MPPYLRSRWSKDLEKQCDGTNACWVRITTRLRRGRRSNSRTWWPFLLPVHSWARATINLPSSNIQMAIIIRTLRRRKLFQSLTRLTTSSLDCSRCLMICHHLCTILYNQEFLVTSPRSLAAGASCESNQRKKLRSRCRCKCWSKISSHWSICSVRVSEASPSTPWMP